MNFIKRSLSLAIMASLTACNVIVNKPVQATGLLNDTGILTCANDKTNFADCTAATTGDAGFDFTKISATGQKLATDAPEWSCVLDNHTGLMWEVKTDDGGLRDKDNNYTWYNPDSSAGVGSLGYWFFGYWTVGDNTHNFTQAVNTQSLCGYSDWRLPNMQELLSIVNYSNWENIDKTYFPNTQGSVYWSSSSVAFFHDYAWCLGYGKGLQEAKNLRGHMLLVR